MRRICISRYSVPFDGRNKQKAEKEKRGGDERESGQNHVPLESRTLSSLLNLAGTHAVDDSDQSASISEKLVEVARDGNVALTASSS